MKHLVVALTGFFALLVFSGCRESKEENLLLGSGTVDAEVTRIFATTQAQILVLNLREGMELLQGDTVAILDTIPLVLKRAELDASALQLSRTIAARQADVATLAITAGGTAREQGRIKNLSDAQGVSASALDQISTQEAAQENAVRAANAGVAVLEAQRVTISAQRAQLADQLARCFVRSPCAGLVTAKYRSLGEMASPAAPLAEIARTDTARVDFFVPQTLLSSLKIGSALRIRLDGAKGEKDAKSLSATITWVSTDAEFTPRNVQTRDARGELVFRIRAELDNHEGLLKRGMPVEVYFP